MKKLKKAEMVRRGQVTALHVCAYSSTVTCYAAQQSCSVVACFCSCDLEWFVALQIDHVRAERDVLAEVHNPYVVKLYYSFQVCK